VGSFCQTLVLVAFHPEYINLSSHSWRISAARTAATPLQEKRICAALGTWCTRRR
jgi:hypothetical protein